jgi:hypothetical protein
MDNFVLLNLHESKNEWCSRLLSIITPLVIALYFGHFYNQNNCHLMLYDLKLYHWSLLVLLHRLQEFLIVLNNFQTVV